MLGEGLLTLLRYWDWSLSLHQALWAEGGVSGWREPAAGCARLGDALSLPRGALSRRVLLKVLKKRKLPLVPLHQH